MTETPHERRFLDLYFAWAISLARRKALEALRHGMQQTSPNMPPVGHRDWNYFAWFSVLDGLGSPALLPQVVLNFVRVADLPEDHPDRHFFDSSAGRVDFVFVHRGKRHIIEIDGPIHHVTEKGYTRNLRVDRTLRNQGWHVHRFSNLEVREAKDFWEFARELGIVPPGVIRTEPS